MMVWRLFGFGQGVLGSRTLHKEPTAGLIHRPGLHARISSCWQCNGLNRCCVGAAGGGVQGDGNRAAGDAAALCDTGVHAAAHICRFHLWGRGALGEHNKVHPQLAARQVWLPGSAPAAGGAAQECREEGAQEVECASRQETCPVQRGPQGAPEKEVAALVTHADAIEMY